MCLTRCIDVMCEMWCVWCDVFMWCDMMYLMWCLLIWLCYFREWKFFRKSRVFDASRRDFLKLFRTVLTFLSLSSARRSFTCKLTVCRHAKTGWSLVKMLSILPMDVTRSWRSLHPPPGISGKLASTVTLLSRCSQSLSIPLCATRYAFADGPARCNVPTGTGTSLKIVSRMVPKKFVSPTGLRRKFRSIYAELWHTLPLSVFLTLSLSGSLTLVSLSSHSPLTLLSLSSHSPLTLLSLSSHSPLTLLSLSSHSPLTLLSLFEFSIPHSLSLSFSHAQSLRTDTGFWAHP